MALTALAPVLGALVFMEAPSSWSEGLATKVLPDLVLLFVMGALFHIYGFVLFEKLTSSW